MKVYVTHQTDEVTGPFERLDGGRMGNVHNRDIVHFQNDVIDLHSAVYGRRTARDDLRQADGRIIADVRVIGAARDAETQTRAASFQDDFLVLPSRFVASVCLS